MIKDARLPLKEKFLEYFKETPIQKFAGFHVGRCEDTISDWKKDDQDFSDWIDKYKADYVKRKIGEVRSPEWILERIFKGDFAQRTETDLTSGGKPLLGGAAKDIGEPEA